MERINERIVAPLAPRERELFIALLAKVACRPTAPNSCTSQLRCCCVKPWCQASTRFSVNRKSRFRA